MDSDDLKLMCWTLAFSCLYANRELALAYFSRPAPVAFTQSQATSSTATTDGGEPNQAALTAVTTLPNGGNGNPNVQTVALGGGAAQPQAGESYLVVLARIMISEFESFEGCAFTCICPK